MKKIFFLTLFIFSVYIGINAQLAMGTWRTHFAYNSVTNIAQSENKVFALASGALYSLDKNDKATIDFYSKVNGLSDNIISEIAYDNKNKQLIIGYSNGNIDLLANNGVYNIPDYFNRTVSLNKNINHITVYNDRAYLSCNFGILVLNLKKREIAESYYIGENAMDVTVLNTTIRQDSIFALAYYEKNNDSVYNIYKASLSNSNLVNYENWSTVPELPNGDNNQKILTFSNELFLLQNNILYIYRDNSFEEYRYENNVITANNIIVSNEKMIISLADEQTAFVDENFNFTYNPDIGHFVDALYDNKRNTYWFSATWQGLKSFENSVSVYPLPKGPALNESWDLSFSGDKLYVVPGGRFGAQYFRGGYVMIYENNRWRNISLNTGFPVLDFMQLTVDPDDKNHYFVTSYGTGLYEFYNDELYALYNADNTDGLDAAANLDPYYYTRLDGGAFDSEGNFWFTNTEVANSVRFLTPDKKIIKLTLNGIDGGVTIGKIHINQLNPNHKWILSLRGGTAGVGILDDNGTPTNTTDDRSRHFNSFADSDGNIVSPSLFYSIAQEKNGTIWLGTNLGPLLFYRPQDAFNSNFTMNRVKIPRNDGTGTADLLLESEHVKAIAIDAANRKWLGTGSSGVFLVSENGQETIHHFNTSNSPLLSDEILSIAIHPVTGEVFFATSYGLISYQGDAATPLSDFKNAYAYPNPVKQDFTGMITIAGLVDNTQVKITDINGNLVCETRSNGSLATWDGTNGYGRKVSTGVYLALCVSENGEMSDIVKILVIN